MYNENPDKNSNNRKRYGNLVRVVYIQTACILVGKFIWDLG